MPFFPQNEFDKNANSVSVVIKGFLFCRVGLATIGVCVFCAVASVAALFYFGGIIMWTCRCGNNCSDDALFCQSCGAKSPIKQIDTFVWILIFSPLVLFVLSWIPEFENHISSISFALNLALIYADATLLKESKKKLLVWQLCGFFLLPSIYLFGRAKKLTGNYAPAITRLCIEIALIVFSLLYSIGIINFHSVPATPQANTSVTTTAPAITNPDNTDTPTTSESDTSDTIDAILLDKQNFTDYTSQKNVTLSTLPKNNDEYSGVPSKYTITDLDANGTNELLVQYSANGDTAVINIQKENIVAYYLPFRSIQELKEDGTTSWSNGAEENGCCRYSFTDKGIIESYTIICNTKDNVFIVNNAQASLTECEDALHYHHSKKNAEWLSVSDITQSYAPDAPSDSTVDSKTTSDIKITKIARKGFQGWMMEIPDPSWIQLGVCNNLGMYGDRLQTIIDNNNAIAGINAGKFDDPDGLGNGGTPIGIVVANGKIIYNSPNSPHDLIGFNEDNVLVVGKYTTDEIKALKIRDAVECTPALIVNGESAKFSGNGGWGYAPRTAIGQKKDGTVLFLVIDGRSVSSTGATMQDLIEIMEEYGAYNAANLDSGSRSVMIHNNEVLNNPSSSDEDGQRALPNAWLVVAPQ